MVRSNGMAKKPRSTTMKAAPAAVDELADTREAPAALPRLRLLEAGDAIITEKGYARATVDEVASYAGVSVDVFYAHFASKGALLRALADRWVEKIAAVTAHATGEGIWTTADPVDVVEIAARCAMDAVFDHAPLVRAILSNSEADSALKTRLRRLGTHLAKRVNMVVAESKVDRGGARTDERAVAFALLTAVALAHHSVLVGASSTGSAFTRDDLTAETARAIRAYLGAGRRTGQPGPAPRPKLATRGNNRTPSGV